MKFFDIFRKKQCDICGSENGIFGNRKLQNGNICTSCAGNLSPLFSKRSNSTVEEIKKQLKYREKNKVKLQSFNPDKSFGFKNKFLIDSEKKAFVVTDTDDYLKKNPDIIEFSQVTSARYTVKENRIERKYKDDQGKRQSFSPPQYDYTYSFWVFVTVQSPWFDKIDVEISSDKPHSKDEQLYYDYEEEAKKIIDLLSTTNEQDEKLAEINTSLDNKSVHTGTHEKKVMKISIVSDFDSGTTTLANALVGRNLSHTATLACTASLSKNLCINNPTFTIVGYNNDGELIQENPEMTPDNLLKIDGVEITEKDSDASISETVHIVYAERDIPFLETKNMALILLDFPPLCYSSKESAQNILDNVINNSVDDGPVLVVIDVSHLGGYDVTLLDSIANQIKNGGPRDKDRFLFVLTKMDFFNPEEESIENAINNVKNYLANYGIEDPQIFPCSAFTALNIRTYFKDVDIDGLTRDAERALPQSAKDTLPIADMLIHYEAMHLEKYSVLSERWRRKIELRLKKAIRKNDINEQVLIHSGICSLEAAINEYAQKL